MCRRGKPSLTTRTKPQKSCIPFLRHCCSDADGTTVDPVIGFGRTRSHQGRHPDAPQALFVRQPPPASRAAGRQKQGGAGGIISPALSFRGPGRSPACLSCLSCVFCLFCVSGGLLDFGAVVGQKMGHGGRGGCVLLTFFFNERPACFSGTPDAYIAETRCVLPVFCCDGMLCRSLR